MQGYDLSKLRVLIVDDHEFMRQLLRGALRGFGIAKVQEATDGQDAAEQIGQFSPDIILTDWNMPRLDGLALVHAVRSGTCGSNPYVPIILISGYSEVPRIRKAANSGIHDYLVKPVTASTLYARIVNLIEKPPKFVRTATYFGPDRRTGQQAAGGPDRRQKAKASPVTKAAEPDDIEIDTGNSSDDRGIRPSSPPARAATRPSPPPAPMSGFEIIEPPVALADKVGRGGLDSEVAIAGGEAAIRDMGDTYVACLEQDLAGFKNALAEARSDRKGAKDHVSKIFDIAHDIRGQAGAQDFPLLADVGDSLCHFIETSEQVDDIQLTVIDLHGEAMNRIVADEMKGQDDAVGRSLLSGLEKVVTKLSP